MVSVGFAVAGVAVSEAAVGFGSSFLDFLLLKRPLKAFFIVSIASSAVVGMCQIAKLVKNSDRVW